MLLLYFQVLHMQLVLSLLQKLLSVLHLTMLLYTGFTQVIGSKIQ